MSASKTTPPPPPRIDVVLLATGEVIHSVALSYTGERYIKCVMLGMLRNLRDDCTLREVLK